MSQKQKPAGILRTPGTDSQRELRSNNAKYRAFVTGVGSGKTTAGA